MARVQDAAAKQSDLASELKELSSLQEEAEAAIKNIQSNSGDKWPQEKLKSFIQTAQQKLAEAEEVFDEMDTESADVRELVDQYEDVTEGLSAALAKMVRLSRY